MNRKRSSPFLFYLEFYSFYEIEYNHFRHYHILLNIELDLALKYMSLIVRHCYNVPKTNPPKSDHKAWDRADWYNVSEMGLLPRPNLRNLHLCYGMMITKNPNFSNLRPYNTYQTFKVSHPLFSLFPPGVFPQLLLFTVKFLLHQMIRGPSRMTNKLISVVRVPELNRLLVPETDCLSVCLLLCVCACVCDREL